MMIYLLNGAATSDVQRADHKGLQAIHYAAKTRRMIEVVKQLLLKGGNLYARDLAFETVLHHAARWHALGDIEQLLKLDNKGQLLSPNKSGHMPSQLALQESSRDVFLYLQGRELEASRGEEAIAEISLARTPVSTARMINHIQPIVILAITALAVAFLASAVKL